MALEVTKDAVEAAKPTTNGCREGVLEVPLQYSIANATTTIALRVAMSY